MDADALGLYDLDALKAEIDRDPDRWRPLVFTNGCFDLLHCGHIRYLRAAKAFGKTLVVGVNSDASVAAIKPQPDDLPPRPIVPDVQRAEAIAALKPVDGTVIFPEQTATNAIETLRPDFYVKGGDYDVESLPEAPTVMAYGGAIELVQIEIPTSTSAIIRRILRQ
ncbi:MAG: adenylyltransferase/cytidyltransferase family protein [Geitlerinemataceae cyanobacterium]